MVSSPKQMNKKVLVDNVSPKT